MNALAGFAATLGQAAGLHGLGAAELLQMLGHFMVLSMLAVGGAITTAPDMNRWLVQQQGWLTDAQFSASVALAQAAPGPNILFVALLGWNVAGAAGLVAAMAGIMGPSSVLAFLVGRYGQRNAQSRALRAFTTGMAPITVGLLVSTGWVLANPGQAGIGTWALMAAAALVSWRTKLPPVLLIAAGGLVGALGWA